MTLEKQGGEVLCFGREADLPANLDLEWLSGLIYQTQKKPQLSRILYDQS